MEDLIADAKTQVGAPSSFGGNDACLGCLSTTRVVEASQGCIDQYILLRELGGGGFGVVYLARDTVAGIEVAVKGLPPLVRNNADELEHIRENFALVSKLHHPRIAAALHLHEAKEVAYGSEQVRQSLRVLQGDFLMVMAFVPGETLAKWRKHFPEGKVPVSQALEVCRQIAEALDYAHGEKIVHRDIKPSNVIVETHEPGGKRDEPSGRRNSPQDVGKSVALSVKVLDFGLAAEIRSSMSRVSQEKGGTSGTWPYMAPEQWAGCRQDGRTDQYALAVLFYKLFSGEVPFASAFDTGDPAIMANAVESKMPAPLAGLTKPQNTALLKALAKEPAQRFSTCAEFVAALSGLAKPAVWDGTRWARYLVSAAALAVLLASVHGAYAAYRSERARVRTANTGAKNFGDTVASDRLLEQAGASFDRKDYLDAFYRYARLSDADAADVTLHRRVEECARLGCLAKPFLDRYLALVSQQPTNAIFRNYLGNAYLLIDPLDKDGNGRNCYGEALRLDPKMAQPLANLGILSYRSGKKAEAVDLFKRYLAAQPHDSQAWVNLGLMYLASVHSPRDGADAELAEKAFRQALQLDPGSYSAHKALGRLLLATGRKTEAWVSLQRSLSLNGDQPDVRELLAGAVESSETPKDEFVTRGMPSISTNRTSEPARK